MATSGLSPAPEHFYCQMPPTQLKPQQQLCHHNDHDHRHIHQHHHHHSHQPEHFPGLMHFIAAAPPAAGEKRGC